MRQRQKKRVWRRASPVAAAKPLTAASRKRLQVNFIVRLLCVSSLSARLFVRHFCLSPLFKTHLVPCNLLYCTMPAAFAVIRSLCYCVRPPRPFRSTFPLAFRFFRNSLARDVKRQIQRLSDSREDAFPFAAGPKGYRFLQKALTFFNLRSFVVNSLDLVDDKAQV